MNPWKAAPLVAAGLVAAGLIVATGAAWGQGAPAPAATPTATPAPAHDHAATEPAKSDRTPGRPDAQLYIGWPNDGMVVASHFKVWFGLRNFGVAPAGVDRDSTGHHHLLIDTALEHPDEPIPSDKQHLHFGNGQTETYLDLPPGRHTLQLVLADGNHVPHDPPIISKKITITVQSKRAPQISAR